ncbi:protein vein isoform X2 [Armigeres subalbatus]|uniref:protein vein isoform X2 n=1 Tax=Armigeres subalbatus TaxID=124917 RepID=UPI002ED440FB
MYLRKWSPIKYLMYLWLAILVWIFCRCESAATMHLAPASSSSSFPQFTLSYASGTRSSRPSSSSSSSGSSSDSFSASRNSISELFANRNHYRVPAASPTSDTSELVDSTSPYQRRSSPQPSTPESTISSQRQSAAPYLTKLFSQAASSDYRRPSSPNSGATPPSYHHPLNYANRVLKPNAKSLPLQQPQQQLPNLPASLSQSNSNYDNRQVKNNYSSSSSISNTSISAESATLAEKRLQQQWKLRMSQKRARRLAHRMHLTEQPEGLALASTNRNRRDSVRAPLANPRRSGGGPGGAGQARRYCSARDPATLAFDAPVVFEGKVKSMSSDRRANFSVTFEIVRVHKKQPRYPLEVFQQVRLQFSFRNYSECDIYREMYRDRGIVREELEQGKVYFLFVRQIDLSNFTILGQPIRKNRRTANGVMEGVKENYGKPPKIYSITSNVTRQEGKRVRLVCKVQGEPPPKVTWFKDKRSINRNVTKYAQVHLKKRSELIIHSVIPSDAGEYECRAKNKFNKISNSTHLRVTAKHSSTKQPKTTHSPEPPYNPRPCKGPGAEHFCLNGGTCIHFEDLQEWACTCPKGFSGNKCENKAIDYHPTTSSKHQDCSYGYGYGGHPECADFLLMDSPALPVIPPMYDYDDDSEI